MIDAEWLADNHPEAISFILKKRDLLLININFATALINSNSNFIYSKMLLPDDDTIIDFINRYATIDASIIIDSPNDILCCLDAIHDKLWHIITTIKSTGRYVYLATHYIEYIDKLYLYGYADIAGYYFYIDNICTEYFNTIADLIAKNKKVIIRKSYTSNVAITPAVLENLKKYIDFYTNSLLNTTCCKVVIIIKTDLEYPYNKNIYNLIADYIRMVYNSNILLINNILLDFKNSFMLQLWGNELAYYKDTKQLINRDMEVNKYDTI